METNSLLTFDRSIGKTKRVAGKKASSCPFCDVAHLTDIYDQQGDMIFLKNKYSRDGEKTDHGLDRGTSYRRGYSRDRGGYGDETYDRYMRHKQSYRDSKTPECKQRMMDALDEHMDKFTQQMEELMRDSDCAEERTAIRHYLDKLKNIA